MKYEFKNIDTDSYELHYTSIKGEKKVIPFKRTVAMATKLQGINAQARLKMYKELTAQGMTKNDLIVRKTDDEGNIYYDESNYREFEENYIATESALILNEIVLDCFKMNIGELLEDMGFDTMTNKDADKVQMFSAKLSAIINGSANADKTPSSTNKE